MNSLIRSVRPKALNRRQARFQREHETCVLCSTALILKFENVTNDKNAIIAIREIAECPACTVRARSCEHALN